MVYLTALEYIRISEKLLRKIILMQNYSKNSNRGQCIKYYPPSTKDFLKTHIRKKTFVKNRLRKLADLVLSKADTGGAL